MAPSISTQQSTPSTLYFSWDEIACGSRRGVGLQYQFRLKLDNDDVIHGWQTGGISALFSDLNACTLYTFEVRGFNNVGPGETTSRNILTSEISK